MNIKSLLLGSAAAIVAVTGARAADAVVIAEPEPMDYVRICDVYGTGFYYIPGTETCLKIGGYVRLDVRGGDFGAVAETDILDRDEGDFDDTYDIRSRLTLRLDARSETELGTLRAFGQIEFNYNTFEGVDAAGNDVALAGNSTSLNQAYIELGGFRAGKTDSLFTTWTGYAGSVILDDVNVAYGPFDTHQIAYTFTGANGFSASIAVEDGDGGNFQLDSYVPDVVGGLAYTQGWGGISVVAGYDSVTEEGAIKGRLDINATEQLSLFVLAGWSTNDSSVGGVDVNAPNNFYGAWSGDYVIFGGGSFKATEKATINAQVAYDEDENFSAGINVDYQLVPGFTITPELVYVDNFDVDDSDGFGGMVRFQRNF